MQINAKLSSQLMGMSVLSKQGMTLLEVLVVLVIVTMMVGFTIHGGEQIRSQMSAQFSLKRSILHHQYAQIKALTDQRDMFVLYDLVKQEQRVVSAEDNIFAEQYSDLKVKVAKQRYHYNSNGEVNQFNTLVFEDNYFTYRLIMHIKWGRIRIEKTERFPID